MRQVKTEVLVIGGGATGTGILRDLAMRGFRAVVVEKRDLAHGTTGRYHGLLHSGGRYVIKDPQAARECITENNILRRIMPHCIEDTGGFFVATPWDDPAYGDRFVEGCHTAGIPVEDVPIPQMLKEEPMLNPQILRCLRVPDASADSFLAAESNVLSAQQYGAQALTYHEVRKLVLSGNRVTGALCYDLEKDEEILIEADLVVNASGAWAGKIAATIDLEVQIKPGKGTMLAVNHRVVHTVVNRCKMPADGDIIVPAHTVAVIGTTDEQVTDPDHFSIEPWEVQLMLAEGEKLIPGFQSLRILRAWAGVRPLYKETATDQSTASRDITRAYVLLDHAERDGVQGFITITSGKWTTYRMMAEATVDKVCQKLGSPRPCKTHLEALPSPQDEAKPHYHVLGGRLAKIEQTKTYGNLVCECELASEADILQAINQGNAKTIDDVRRDTRLGMGPCQGGFCTLRVAGLLQQQRKLPAEDAHAALNDFLQERWKGLLAILWGQQMRQERLDELIYLDVLNVDHLPGAKKTRLGSENYAAPESAAPSDLAAHLPSRLETPIPGSAAQPMDLLVIGAGLAGLTAAWQAAASGRSVRCITKGWGALYWSTGCIDVLGYLPGDPNQPVQALQPALEHLIQANPTHPYTLCGVETISKALQSFQGLCAQAGYPMLATGESPLGVNWMLPSGLGGLRPTCLAPITMTAGDCRTTGAGAAPVLVAGFAGYPDFYPDLVAANLTAQGIPAQAVMLDIPSLRAQRFITARVLAQHFEDPAFVHEVVTRLRSLVTEIENVRVGFPAVLGLHNSVAIWQALQDELACPVFEIPGLPPSIPGIRLHHILVKAIQRHAGRVEEGMQVIGAQMAGSRVAGVWSEASARPKAHRARRYILATGGILGGGWTVDPADHIQEQVFNLPISTPEGMQNWFHPNFAHPPGHSLFRCGVQVDQKFHPIEDPASQSDRLISEDIQVIGAALSGADALRERALEGIALATAFAALDHLPAPQTVSSM
jgi:glycerol-3-phosphate dehydrogenase